jgi:hypothetical protein
MVDRPSRPYPRTASGSHGLRNASTDRALQPFSAIPLPPPAYKRFFNHYGINYVIENGAPTQSSGFYDLSAALK